MAGADARPLPIVSADGSKYKLLFGFLRGNPYDFAARPRVFIGRVEHYSQSNRCPLVFVRGRHVDIAERADR